MNALMYMGLYCIQTDRGGEKVLVHNKLNQYAGRFKLQVGNFKYVAKKTECSI